MRGKKKNSKRLVRFLRVGDRTLEIAKEMAQAEQKQNKECTKSKKQPKADRS